MNDLPDVVITILDLNCSESLLIFYLHCDHFEQVLPQRLMNVIFEREENLPVFQLD